MGFGGRPFVACVVRGGLGPAGGGCVPPRQSCVACAPSERSHCSRYSSCCTRRRRVGLSRRRRACPSSPLPRPRRTRPPRTAIRVMLCRIFTGSGTVLLSSGAPRCARSLAYVLTNFRRVCLSRTSNFQLLCSHQVKTISPNGGGDDPRTGPGPRGRDQDPARTRGPGDPLQDAAAGWRRLPAGADWMDEHQWAARPAGEEPPDPDRYPDPEDPPLPGEVDLDAIIAECRQITADRARAAAMAAAAGTTGALAAGAAKAAGRRGPQMPGSEVLPGGVPGPGGRLASGMGLDTMPRAGPDELRRRRGRSGKTPTPGRPMMRADRRDLRVGPGEVPRRRPQARRGCPS